MERRTFMENSKYDYWVLHKKLFQDEIFTLKLNIGPRILNPNTLG